MEKVKTYETIQFKIKIRMQAKLNLEIFIKQDDDK